MMKTASVIVLCILIGGLLIIGGCATKASKPGPVVAHPKFEKLCSNCHTLDRVHQAHQELTRDQMRTIVDRMAKKPESGIDLHDIDDIVEEIY